MSTLYLLPAGEYNLIKRSKYGITVLINGSKVYIPYSDTLNESIFDTNDDLENVSAETPLKGLISL